MGGRVYSRRQFVGTGIASAGMLAFGPGFWRSALAAPATIGDNPYGPLHGPDANGLRLPAGFRSRVIARGGQPVEGTGYVWHIFSDGQATFPAANGGWILVSNSESPAASGGGSSAIRFHSDGRIAAAYRILAATNVNCAGGPTPWGAWLSCEEYDGGHVWECDPGGVRSAAIRPAMGTFNHEAVCVDPSRKQLYMTEDEPDGCLYRFTPDSYPDLSSGLLEVGVGSPDSSLTWREVPDPTGISGPTRNQVDGAARYDGGEGIWFDSGFVYFSTKGDNKIRAYDTATGAIEVVYDKAAYANAPLSGLDNVTVSPFGDLFVCEDGDDMDIGIITRERVASRFLQLTGSQHNGSEMAGVIFDPSGTRMYFSSQRGAGLGIVYEVSGPFRLPDGYSAPQPVSPAGKRRRAARIALASRRRMRLRTLLRRGIVVRVTVDSPGRAIVALRSSDLVRVPGERGSSPRPKQVTLAARRVRLKRAGRHKIRLRLRPRAAARLRRRRARTTDARLTAAATRSGRKLVTTRRVTLIR